MTEHEYHIRGQKNYLLKAGIRYFMKKSGMQGYGAPSGARQPKGNVRSANGQVRSNGNSYAGSRSASSASRQGGSSYSEFRAPQKTGAKPASKAQASRKTAKKKKKSGGKAAGVVVFLVLAAAVAAAVLWFNGTISAWLAEKVDVTLADGTTETMALTEAYDAININTFAPGIVIDNIAVGGMTLEQGKAAVAAAQPERPIDINIDLNLDGKTIDLDLGSLGLESNLDEVVNEAYSYLKPVEGDEENADAVVAKFNAIQQLQKTQKTYNTAYTVKSEGIHDIVNKVLKPYVVEMKNAEITGFNTEALKFNYTPSNKGYDINIDKAAKDVKEMLDSAQYQGVVEVDANITEPTLTGEYIEANFGLRSSAYSTTSPNSNRNKNITRACELMNGKVLNPGEQFSYNGVVGQRTKANGFYEATVILGGQYEKGMGGGICQTSTMLYDAVLKGDLKVVSRHTHAWPSDYVDVGLDATVDYGNLDFVFENNTQYPIVIVAYWKSSDRTCHVEIYGDKLPNGQKIKLSTKITSKTEPSGTEYVANNEMAVGTTNTVRAAHTGYVAVSYQVWLDADGNEIDRKEVTTSRYNAYKKRVEVGTKYVDGVIGKLDPATGKVTRPDGSPDPADTSSSDTKPTDSTPAPSSDTKPTDNTSDSTKATKDTKATEPSKDTKKTKASVDDGGSGDGNDSSGD